MASASTIDNNELSIDDLMYEIPYFYDEEPDEIIKYKKDCDIKYIGASVGQNGDKEEGWIEVIYTNSDDDGYEHAHALIRGFIRVFYNKHTRITHSENEIRVFHKKYCDPVSGRTHISQNMVPLRPVKIVNEHYVIAQEAPSEDTTTCMFQYSNVLDVAFILNIEDIRKKPALALEMIGNSLEKDEKLSVLPSELVKLISREYFSCSSEKGSPSFKLEFKGKIPQVVSRDQLKRLYEAGIVKMAFRTRILTYNFIILSDEAFDDEGWSGVTIRQRYGSRERMHFHKQELLEYAFSLH